MSQEHNEKLEAIRQKTKVIQEGHDQIARANGVVRAIRKTIARLTKERDELINSQETQMALPLDAVEEEYHEED